MPREIKPAKYFKYKECEVNAMLVNTGEFVGVTEGVYGALYNFYDLEGNHIVLNRAGKLNYLYKNKGLVKGGVYNIIFLGKIPMTKGPFKGKDMVDFKVEVFSNLEIEKLKKENPSWDKMYGNVPDNISDPLDVDDGPRNTVSPIEKVDDADRDLIDDLDDLE